MKYIIPAFLCIALVGASPPTKTPQSFLGSLHVDQRISLVEHGDKYEITMFQGKMPLPFTVVEVGQDYVVVRDMAGVADLNIPIYSIKAIKAIRMPVGG
jgi:hypothetical protein